MSAHMTTPDQLSSLLQIPFSDEQLMAITAPLAPGVIIAGAGTGKTTVMAARVVWLVATGQVRPDQVLGLTFTRKAALELSQRVDEALTKADLAGAAHVADEGRQLITTYDSFIGRLVADHGLRIGIDTDQILITGATRYRLAARAVSEAEG
ncbi:MAG: UvrD-helicase domain-containing protein, partial [Propionibacterium sp.]|nr:UvrD-helicase domain-containing protein [Propionibacterium sp.]